MGRRVAAGLVMVLVAALLGSGQGTAQSSGEEAAAVEDQRAVLNVCVAVRRADDGRVEVALQHWSADDGCGERLLPRRRRLPPSAGLEQWLVTSPVLLEGHELRVAARRHTDGRIELAVQRHLGPDRSWGPRLLPEERFLPQDSAVGQWRSSSPVDVTAQQVSYLTDAQIVTYYGYPRARLMGILGRGSPTEIADQVTEMAAQYDRLNGDRDVIGAFHLITGVAQAHPTPDGTWIHRLSGERISEYVELARRRGMIVFLDNQIGWSDPLTETKLLEEFLREPFVHLALDPEFATKRNGRRPGLVIGSVTAEEVNEVQHYLAGLVAEESIPPKILMVHQFTPGMLRDRDKVESVDGVDLSIDMDGFGGIHIKLANYERFALPAPSEWPAMKLFFRYDTPLLSPERIQGLEHPPDIIVYQ